MRKKLNWKSLIALTLTIAMPMLQPKLDKIGVQIAPASFMPYFGMVFFIALDPATINAFIQAFAALVGGITAHGAYYRGKADWTTNIQGAVASIFILAAGAGFHFSTELRTSIGAFAALLVATFSAHPDHTDILQS